MSAVLEPRALSSLYNKMDNVLYEINDTKGIPSNTEYDSWKVEVLSNLLEAGFIKSEGDLYILTKEGREVIDHDSVHYYNKKMNIAKAKVEKAIQENSGPSINFINLGIFLVVLGMIAFGFYWTVVKYQNFGGQF